MITADFAILPVGTKDTECKEYVTAAVQAIKDSGLNYQLTGMGTQIGLKALLKSLEEQKIPRSPENYSKVAQLIHDLLNIESNVIWKTEL